MKQSMTPDRWDQLQDDLSKHSRRLPKRGDFGIFAWGDAPGGIGGGVGWFYWRPSRVSAVRFIRKYGIALNMPRSDLDLVAIDAQLEQITTKMLAGTISDKAALAALNKALRWATQFDWMGDYRELLEGKTKYAKDLRGRFRDDERNNGPIRPSERKDWLEFLELSGI